MSQSQEDWLAAASDPTGVATHNLINQAGSYENGPHRLPTGLVAGALFVGGAYCVPKGRARWYYALVIPLFIAGCHFLRDGGRTPASESSWWWYGEFHQTLLSLFFFGLSILSFLMLALSTSTFGQAWRNVKAREAQEAALAAQMAADVAWLAQEPRSLVPVTVKPSNAVVVSDRRTAPVQDTPAPAPAPTSTSKLWLPSSPERRVRRGGTTLSGTPIKDRRSVNPETLDEY
jgi:type II secretory pathway pseudopilin PulG